MTKHMKDKLHVPRILLLIETSHNYGRQLIEGIGRYAREHGPWSFAFEEHGLNELSIQTLNRREMDGVISRIRDVREGRQLKASRIPYVELYGNPTCKPHFDVDTVVLAQMAIEHFRNAGFRHFAFFARDVEPWVSDRRQKFAEQLAGSRQPCHVFDPRPPPGAVRGQDSPGNWITRLPKPVGVLCANDVEALALLETCRRLRIAIPDEVAVLGVDNDPSLCSIAWPRLSSIDLDAQHTGYRAAEMLNRLMGGDKPPSETIRIPPKEVIVRETTDVLAIPDVQVVQAIRMIHQFACKGIGVDHVADQMAMSRRTLERRFKSAVGRTLKDEIQRIRIDRAHLLLQQPEHTIKQIAHLTGFGSVQYFTRAFLRETAETPCAYRNRRKLAAPTAKV